MMSSHDPMRAVNLLVALVVATAALGCGGDDAGAPARDASAPASSGADGAVDAGCPLTTEEVSSVIDGELSDMGCGWTGARADVFLSVYPGELWSEYRAQHDAAVVLPVTGLGDEAYLVENGALHVLVGDSAFDVMVHATDPALDADAAKRALADMIVAKVAS
jgi:hypothetical protein